MNDEIQRLTDRLDISDVITRYAFALDQCDWAAMEEVWDDEVDVDLPHVESGSEKVSRTGMIDMIRATVGGFEATHHMITNHLVTVNGDEASVKNYANAWHSVPTERGVTDYCLVRGFYDWRLRRTPEGWRINGMKVTFHGPVEGYMGVYQIAAERQAAGSK
jgi:3-phenylpropionate/cinnamic acid dioxygenase small subunit